MDKLQREIDAQKESQYRTLLVRQIKLVGQTLIDSADDIVSRAKFSTGLSISVDFDQGLNARAPEITVTQSFLPDPTELLTMYQKSINTVWNEEVK